jgi:hypothetical protein
VHFHAQRLAGLEEVDYPHARRVLAREHVEVAALA